MQAVDAVKAETQQHVSSAKTELQHIIAAAQIEPRGGPSVEVELRSEIEAMRLSHDEAFSAMKGELVMAVDSVNTASRDGIAALESELRRHVCCHVAKVACCVYFTCMLHICHMYGCCMHAARMSQCMHVACTSHILHMCTAGLLHVCRRYVACMLHAHRIYVTCMLHVCCTPVVFMSHAWHVYVSCTLLHMLQLCYVPVQCTLHASVACMPHACYKYVACMPHGCCMSVDVHLCFYVCRTYVDLDGCRSMPRRLSIKREPTRQLILAVNLRD